MNLKTFKKNLKSKRKVIIFYWRLNVAKIFKCFKTKFYCVIIYLYYSISIMCIKKVSKLFILFRKLSTVNLVLFQLIKYFKLSVKVVLIK